MKALKRYAGTICILVLLLTVLRLAVCIEIFAQASESGRSGSIAVELNDLGTDRSNVVFRLYDVSQTDPSVESSELSKLSSREIKELAKKLEKKATKENVRFLEQKTDGKGRAVFSDLKDGIYLISQYAQAEYGAVAPFLVLLPYSEDGKTFTYEVIAKPKGEALQPETTPEPSEIPEPSTTPEFSKTSAPSVKTEDVSQTGLYTILLCAGGITAAVLLVWKKRTKYRR